MELVLLLRLASILRLERGNSTEEISPLSSSTSTREPLSSHNHNMTGQTISSFEEHLDNHGNCSARVQHELQKQCDGLNEVSGFILALCVLSCLIVFLTLVICYCDQLHGSGEGHRIHSLQQNLVQNYQSYVSQHPLDLPLFQRKCYRTGEMEHGLPSSERSFFEEVEKISREDLLEAHKDDQDDEVTDRVLANLGGVILREEDECPIKSQVVGRLHRVAIARQQRPLAIVLNGRRRSSLTNPGCLGPLEEVAEHM